ncbi:hypothetical protein SGLAM104S_06202 [Streptomyces glaucescens]
MLQLFSRNTSTGARVGDGQRRRLRLGELPRPERHVRRPGRTDRHREDARGPGEVRDRRGAVRHRRGDDRRVPAGKEIKVRSDKTIVGSGTSGHIVGGGFFLGPGVHNVIIRDPDCATPSTSCSPNWTASTRRPTRACSCWPPPMCPGMWTTPCGAPAGWTARSSSCRPTAHPRGDPPVPPAGPAHRERRPRQAGQGHRRPVGRRPGPSLRRRGRAGAARLGAHRHGPADRHEGPAGRGEGRGAVRRAVVRLRAERGDVRQQGAVCDDLVPTSKKRRKL